MNCDFCLLVLILYILITFSDYNRKNNTLQNRSEYWNFRNVCIPNFRNFWVMSEILGEPFNPYSNNRNYCEKKEVKTTSGIVFFIPNRYTYIKCIGRNHYE